METKTCTTCRETKAVSEFTVKQSSCKKCRSEKKSKNTQTKKQKDREEREQKVKELIANYKSQEWDTLPTKCWGKGYMMIMTNSQHYQYMTFCCYLQDYLTFEEILKRVEPPIEIIPKTNPLYEKMP